MGNIKTYDYTNFSKGIEKISIAKDLEKLELPELARLVPSEPEDTQLKKLWKPLSLEDILKESLLPTIKNREDLTPIMYQKRLQEAKLVFQKLVNSLRSKKAKKEAPFDEESEEGSAEIFEQVIADLEELEQHQDLLWMLRQVVHLA